MAVVASILCATMACEQPPARQPEAERTSEEYVRLGVTDTVFLRRLRTVESISGSIDTDSLAKLYARSFDASNDEMVGIADAIGCQYYLILRRYGYAPLKRARRRVQDSLVAIPGNKARAEASQARWPTQSTGTGSCDATGLTVLPDSLTQEPIVPPIPRSQRP